MGYTLRIHVAKGHRNGGLVTCRQVTVRERRVRFLLGTPMKLTVIVPGDSVEEVEIKEVDRSYAEPV